MATVTVEVALFDDADYQAEETVVTIDCAAAQSTKLGFQVIAF